MKKITAIKTEHVLLKYILKVILSTFISILCFSYLAGKIVYKLDADLKVNLVISLFICAICSAAVAFISVLGFRNNGLLLGALAQLPLLFYSLLNVIFNENTWLFFGIKAVIIICVGMLFGHLAGMKSSKVKI